MNDFIPISSEKDLFLDDTTQSQTKTHACEHVYSWTNQAWTFAKKEMIGKCECNIPHIKKKQSTNLSTHLPISIFFAQLAWCQFSSITSWRTAFIAKAPQQNWRCSSTKLEVFLKIQWQKLPVKKCKTFLPKVPQIARPPFFQRFLKVPFFQRFLTWHAKNLSSKGSSTKHFHVSLVESIWLNSLIFAFFNASWKAELGQVLCHFFKAFIGMDPLLTVPLGTPIAPGCLDRHHLHSMLPGFIDDLCIIIYYYIDAPCFAQLHLSSPTSAVSGEHCFLKSAGEVGKFFLHFFLPFWATVWQEDSVVTCFLQVAQAVHMGGRYIISAIDLCFKGSMPVYGHFCPILVPRQFLSHLLTTQGWWNWRRKRCVPWPHSLHLLSSLPLLSRAGALSGLLARARSPIVALLFLSIAWIFSSSSPPAPSCSHLAFPLLHTQVPAFFPKAPGCWLLPLFFPLTPWCWLLPLFFSKDSLVLAASCLFSKGSWVLAASCLFSRGSFVLAASFLFSKGSLEEVAASSLFSKGSLEEVAVSSLFSKGSLEEMALSSCLSCKDSLPFASCCSFSKRFFSSLFFFLSSLSSGVSLALLSWRDQEVVPFSFESSYRVVGGPPGLIIFPFFLVLFPWHVTFVAKVPWCQQVPFSQRMVSFKPIPKLG